MILGFLPTISFLGRVMSLRQFLMAWTSSDMQIVYSRWRESFLQYFALVASFNLQKLMFRLMWRAGRCEASGEQAGREVAGWEAPPGQWPCPMLRGRMCLRFFPPSPYLFTSPLYHLFTSLTPNLCKHLGRQFFPCDWATMDNNLACIWGHRHAFW